MQIDSNNQYEILFLTKANNENGFYLLKNQSFIEINLLLKLNWIYSKGLLILIDFLNT